MMDFQDICVISYPETVDKALETVASLPRSMPPKHAERFSKVIRKFYSTSLRVT